LPKATVVDGESLWIERERCYQLYEAWCVDNGISPSNRAYFGADLRNLIPKIPDKNRGIGVKPKMTQWDFSFCASMRLPPSPSPSFFVKNGEELLRLR
jgi:hypothetical protein